MAGLLERLRGDGPLTSRQLPDSCVVPWQSSGWNDERNVARMLDVLEARGEVAVASREGRERRWDLAERIHPGDAAVPVAEARAFRSSRTGFAAVPCACSCCSSASGSSVGWAVGAWYQGHDTIHLRRHRFVEVGGLLLGVGGFQLYDGLVQHKVFGLHQIRYGVDLLAYDLTWNVVAAALVVTGAVLTVRSGHDRAVVA